MGSIFFPLIVADVISSTLKHSSVQKLGFDDTDTNTQRMCVHLLLIV